MYDTINKVDYVRIFRLQYIVVRLTAGFASGFGACLAAARAVDSALPGVDSGPVPASPPAADTPPPAGTTLTTQCTPT